ncbi:hypothetical protein [Clostridium tagluense]|uniref:Uncharacterized protein n=1 Tax=Clostridium tagluense TaxID=360422 RepID=A0A401USR6_9CLOT|nr:hypothetical protein [Clostridium tagluense]GCD12599.1 hypothetical protein Ctaglu_42220 [Clostridium tagluense]
MYLKNIAEDCILEMNKFLTQDEIFIIKEYTKALGCYYKGLNLYWENEGADNIKTTQNKFCINIYFKIMYQILKELIIGVCKDE